MTATTIAIDAHPLLGLWAFETRLPRPLSEMPSPPSLQALLAMDSEAPIARSEEVRAAVRDLLRHGGYKPTGRGKPASEYLLRAASEGALAGINLAVDACNAVSLHSGIPISVVDLDRAAAPLRVTVVEAGSYAFNAAGQEIALAGMLCLCDAAGPCANAVKDSQRTKTHDGTRRTLSLLWGPRAFADHVAQAGAWYRALLADAGAQTEMVC